MTERSWVPILAVTIRIVLALVMIVPLIVTTPPLPNTFFPFVVGKALWTRTLIEIAFGLWVILALKDSSYRFPRSWTLAALGGYVLIALLATVFSVSPTRSMWSTYERMQGWIDLAHWFTFVLLLASVLRTWRHWLLFLNFNVGVGVVFGLLSLDQYLYQLFDIKLTGFLGDTFTYLHQKTPAWRTFRLSVTFGNPTYVGGYMIVNAFIAAALLGGSFVGRPRVRDTGRRAARARQRQAQGKSGWGATFRAASPWFWRAFWTAAIALQLVIIYISATRGPMIALAVGVLMCGIAFAAWGRTPRLRMVMRIATAVFAVLISVLLGLVVTVSFGGGEVVEGFGTMIERWTGAGVQDLSVLGRTSSARIGLEAALNRPVLGWGPENYTIAYDRYAGPDVFSQEVITSFDQAHNKPVEEISTKGVLGGAAYMAVWVLMLVVFIRKTRFLETGNQAFAVLLGGALVAYFVQNIFLFDTPGTAHQFFALVGFAVFLGSLPLGADASSPGRKEKSSIPKANRGALGPLRTAVNTISARCARLTSPVAGFIRGRASAMIAVRAGAVLAAAGVIALMFFVNFRTLNASIYTLDALDAELPWEAKFQAFEDSVDTFSPLGHYVRILMIQQIGREWDNLNLNQKLTALDLVKEHGEEAISTEPEEWRIVAAVAALYQLVSRSEDTFVPRARTLVDKAAKLAPSRVEVHRLLAAQRLTEGDPHGALDVIDAYVMKAPDTARHFERLRGSIENQIEESHSSEEEEEEGEDGVGKQR